jgi:hypothetical protein
VFTARRAEAQEQDLGETRYCTAFEAFSVQTNCQRTLRDTGLCHRRTSLSGDGRLRFAELRLQEVLRGRKTI